MENNKESQQTIPPSARGSSEQDKELINTDESEPNTELYADNPALKSLPSHIKSQYEVHFDEIGPGEQRQGLIKTLRLDEMSFLADVPDSIPIAGIFEGCELFLVPDFDKNNVPDIQSDAVFLTNDNLVYIFRNRKLVLDEKNELKSFVLNTDIERFGLPMAKPQDPKKPTSFAHVDNRAIQKRLLVKHIEKMTNTPFHPEYTRYSLRPKAKQRFNIRGHQIVDRYVGAYEKAKIGKSSQAQFTHVEKENYTKKQPCSYYDLDREQTSTFGFDTRDVLIGIKDFGGLIGSIYGYDMGSVGRPNERETLAEAKTRLEQLIKNGNTPGHIKHYDNSQFGNFTKEGFIKDKHNELLVRLNWNPWISSVCIIHDNFQSRCAAYALAERLNERLIPLGLPKAPISYHTSDKKKGLISEEQRYIDRIEANRMFNDPDIMNSHFKRLILLTPDFEFMLLVDSDKLTPDFFSSSEFRTLFENRSYIAEALIHKYVTYNKLPVELPADFFDTLKIQIMPRSIIEKISSKNIIIKNRTNKERNLEENVSFITKSITQAQNMWEHYVTGTPNLFQFHLYRNLYSSDFSGLDLSKINLNGRLWFKKHFEGINFSLATFDVSILRAGSMENCDLRGSNLLPLILDAKRKQFSINLVFKGGCKLFSLQKELDNYIEAFKDAPESIRGLDLLGFNLSGLSPDFLLSILKHNYIHLDDPEQIIKLFNLNPTYKLMVEIEKKSSLNLDLLKYMFEKIVASKSENIKALNWAVNQGLTEIAAAHLTPEFFLNEEFKNNFYVKDKIKIVEAVIQAYFVNNKEPIALPYNIFSDISMSDLPRSIIQLISSHSIVIKKRIKSPTSFTFSIWNTVSKLKRNRLLRSITGKNPDLFQFNDNYVINYHNFSKLDLSMMDFTDKDFDGVNFALTNLNDSILQARKIRNCDFRGSNFLSLLFEAKKNNYQITDIFDFGCKLFKTQEELNTYIELFKSEPNALVCLNLFGFNLQSAPPSLILSTLRKNDIPLNIKQLKELFDFKPTLDTIKVIFARHKCTPDLYQYFAENIDLELNENKQVLNWAIEQNQTDLALNLIKRHTLNSTRKESNDATPLYTAAETGKVEVLKYLIKHGANINEKNKNGSTATHAAAYFGKIETFKHLINKGANIQAKDNSGDATIHYAAVSGQTEILRILLNKKANIHTKGYHGKTVLHIAAENEKIEALKLLVEKGGNINVKNDSGLTALQTIVTKFPPDITLDILNSLPTLHAKIAAGKTAIILYAEVSNTTETAALLNWVNELEDEKMFLIQDSPKLYTPISNATTAQTLKTKHKQNKDKDVTVSLIPKNPEI